MPAITDVTWPANSPVTVLKTIPAYPYVQYQDDDNIAAFFDAFNIYAQGYVDWFNSLDLPIYTKAPVEGALLDWVAQGLYGIMRPGLPVSQGSPEEGPVNTFQVNSLPLNGFIAGTPDTYISVNDDYFRRILTWKLYRGDGDFPSLVWLKRRINRFLYGVDGKDIANNTTFNISIVPTDVRKYTITLPGTTQSSIFKYAVEANVIDLPFQDQWTIVLAASGEDPFVFDTTGSGTAQIISLPYAVANPQTVIISVNGLRQNADEYTLTSGNILTFTAEAGSSVEIVGPVGNLPDPWVATGTTIVGTVAIPVPISGGPAASVLVYVNGLRANVSEYEIVGSNVMLTSDTAGLGVEIVPL